MQVVLNTMRIVEEVARSQPIGVGALARRLDLPKSTVFRALRALSDAGWLRSRDDGPAAWELGPKALTVSSRALSGSDLRSAVLPAMEDLRTETMETVHLAVLDGNQSVIVDRLDSPQVVRSSYPLGFRLPAHTASTGRAMLSHLSIDEVRSIIGADLVPTASADRSALIDELAVIRANGYACGSEESGSGIVSVAAAILDRWGRPAAAISVSAPVQRLPPDDLSEVGELVSKTVRALVAP